MDIIDSLTKQIISEGENVLIIVMVNSRSEDNSVGLVTRLSDQYKLASLPIKAFWSGYCFEIRPEDREQLAIESFMRSVGLEGGKVEQFLSQLWVNGSTVIDKPHWNCSNLREYTVFAIKQSTFDKLAETSVVRENVPMLDIEAHAQAALQYIQPYLAAEAAYQEARGKVDAETRVSLSLNIDKYRRMVFLGNDHGYDREYEGMVIPYAAYALKGSSESKFSFQLRKALLNTDFGFDGPQYNAQQYVEFYTAVHLATALLHAMSYLDLPLAPTYWAQSRRRECSKLEFLSKVLIEELSVHCQEAKDYSDDPVQEVGDLLAPLKACVDDLGRLLA